jgi:hypothetical protein
VQQTLHTVLYMVVNQGALKLKVYGPLVLFSFESLSFMCASTVSQMSIRSWSRPYLGGLGWWDFARYLCRSESELDRWGALEIDHPVQPHLVGVTRNHNAKLQITLYLYFQSNQLATPCVPAACSLDHLVGGLQPKCVQDHDSYPSAHIILLCQVLSVISFPFKSAADFTSGRGK